MMLEGMMWMDADPRKSLDVKVQEAAKYFHDKYSQIPNTCFVHPSMLVDVRIIDEIEVRPSKEILRNNFFIGVELTGPERSEKKTESAFTGNPA
jgi:hypothetical protein